MASLRDNAKALMVKVKAFDGMISANLLSLRVLCGKVFEATEEINRAWSGSALGYHSDLYYGAFQTVPLGFTFSPEWGGMKGLQEGWQTRTPDEVRQHIEESTGTTYLPWRTASLRP